MKSKIVGWLIILSLNLAAVSLAVAVWIDFFGGFEILQNVYHSAKGTQIPEKHFKDLHRTSYYGESLAKDPYQQFTVMHLNPYYLFSLPWETKTREVQSNRIVSISPNGFRNVASSDAGERAAFLGGSAAFGHFSSSDATTIASLLNVGQKRLNFENLNAPSWNSHQELVALAKNYERNGKPLRVTISFSVMNDISVNQSYKNRNWTLYPDAPDAFGKLYDCFDDIRSEPRCKSDFLDSFRRYYTNSNTRYLLGKMLPRFVDSTIGGDLAKRAPGEDARSLDEGSVITEKILNNHSIMRRIMASGRGRHILVIQPLYGLHATSSDAYKGHPKEYYELVRSVVRRIMQSEFCRTDCYDFSRIFDESHRGATIIYGLKKAEDGTDLSSYFFADEIHLTDAGSRFVVAKIENILKK